jgi:hypothetical protein
MEQEGGMSILLLTIVIAAVLTDASLLTNEILISWALFAIADALWVNVLRGKK